MGNKNCRNNYVPPIMTCAVIELESCFAGSLVENKPIEGVHHYVEIKEQHYEEADYAKGDFETNGWE